MIVIHASFPIEPERRDEALEIANTLVERSNQEPGTVDYRASTDIKDTNVIRFVERYEDADAFEAHVQTEHFQNFEEKLPDLLAGEPEVVRFEVDDATKLEL
jgi:quinol monooxygenase YgiN